MGYLTKFDLKILNDSQNNKVDYIQEIGKISKYGEDMFDEEIKWYDKEQNMKMLSEKYPETLFMLTGKGEEAEDIWIEYYLNGKCQREDVQFIFNDYDPLKLK